METKFTTEIDSSKVDVHNIDGMELEVTNTATGKSQKYTVMPNDEIACSDFTVKWSFGMNIKEWGIKSIDFLVTEAIGSVFIRNFNDEGEQINEYEYIPTVEIFTENFDMENGCVLPDGIEINVKENKLTVF